MTLTECRQQFDRLSGRREQVLKDLGGAKAEAEKHADESQLLTDVIEVFELAGAHAREAVQRDVGGLMTAAMQDVFGPESGAELEFEATTRGYQAQVRTWTPQFRGNPMRTDGGSTCRILAVALRAAFLRRMNDLPQVLLLDEPYIGMDPVRFDRAVEWLKRMSEITGIQVIVVSPQQPEVWERHADKVVQL